MKGGMDGGPESVDGVANVAGFGRRRFFLAAFEDLPIRVAQFAASAGGDPSRGFPAGLSSWEGQLLASWWGCPDVAWDEAGIRIATETALAGVSIQTP